jgi:adenylylsulfate kinase
MDGIAVWITGLPGSGKSSIADSLKERLPDFVVLRMDELRKVVTPEPSYSDEERDIVYRCLVFLAKELTDLGHSVIIDATGNLKKWRELARSLIPGYVEVYLECSIDECRRRELQRRETRGAPRDIYKKGEKGWPVPGVNAPYEKPVSPEIVIDAERTSVEDGVDKVSDYIKGMLR